VAAGEDQMALHGSGCAVGIPVDDSLEDFVMSSQHVDIPLGVTAVDIGVVDGAFFQTGEDGGVKVVF